MAMKFKPVAISVSQLRWSVLNLPNRIVSMWTLQCVALQYVSVPVCAYMGYVSVPL